MRVAHLALDRIPLPVDPIAVALSRVNTGHEAVPDVAVDLSEGDPRLVPGRIEQAEVHCLGDLREQGEVSAPFLPRSAERIRVPGQMLIHPPGPNQTLLSLTCHTSPSQVRSNRT